MTCSLFVTPAYADGPEDNKPEAVRPIPPPGIVVPEATKAALLKQADELAAAIRKLESDPKLLPQLRDVLPDVWIFEKAVRWALTYNEVYLPREPNAARELLTLGERRLQELQAATPKWNTATGLILRGYKSKIDGSIQPYGLVVPASYSANSPYRHRLDIWLHGRGEKTLELQFLDQRRKSPGEFTPKDAIVLHPFGRYCNAFKFAGETDVFEALADVQKRYRIDENRIVMRGFSMGGAGCWQFTTRHPGLWVAATPGAGFSETADFLKVFQKEAIKPTWYEIKMWNLYDSTTHAGNLFNVPTVAYSGELDRQKQAADFMAKSAEKEGLKLAHVIGPKTEHKYHPESKKEIERLLGGIVDNGRPATPKRVRFTTHTLRYNRMRWLEVDRLKEHWLRSEADAELDDAGVSLSLANVAGFTLDFAAGTAPWPAGKVPRVRIDGRAVECKASVGTERGYRASFAFVDGLWRSVEGQPNGRVKRHGLQGPIDDAFMEPFLFVRPTGEAWHQATAAFVKREMEHAADHWRKQFRGIVRIKDDKDVTASDLAYYNLILWGDPSSNAWIKKFVEKLAGDFAPALAWTREAVAVAGQPPVAAANHMPVLIYPNVLLAKPTRYVVLNSGFTFREYDYLSNARQTPKLPDWALVDVSQPATSRTPGRIVNAGFCDENWQPKSPPKE